MMTVSEIVNSVFSSKTYLLFNGEKTELCIVDCGDVLPIIELAESIAGSSFIIKSVLLTHSHYDHFYGLPRLTDLFPNIKVYTNEYGKKALSDSKMNLSIFHQDPISYKSDNVIVLQNNSLIKLFDDVDSIVHYTPGHNPACLTYEVGDYLFTGDSYIPNIRVVTNLPGSDKKLAQQSLDYIKGLAKGKIICPGH